MQHLFQRQPHSVPCRQTALHMLKHSPTATHLSFYPYAGRITRAPSIPRSLARDPSAGVRRAVCAGLVQLLHLQPKALLPQMHDIIEYILESSQVGPSHSLGDSVSAGVSTTAWHGRVHSSNTGWRTVRCA